MGFDYQSFLNDKIFEELNKIKAFSPEVVEQEAAARKKPGFPKGLCILMKTEM